MFFKWLPWNFILSRLAKSYGFIDPAMVLARIRSFSQPSEVQEPLELVKAGVIFQARGLINTRVFQFNLDWIWPLWVEKQFNPKEPSFIPRAYSFSHINLTHRNWTAAGLPDLPLYPLVDPRGMITPLYDGWSLEFWIISADSPHLLPSKLKDVKQRQIMEQNLTVVTEADLNSHYLKTSASLEMKNNIPILNVQSCGRSGEEGCLVLVLRPYNPEGVSFIDRVVFDRQENSFLVNRQTPIFLDKSPAKVLFSNFDSGDVFHYLAQEETRQQISCRVGLATAAAMYPLSSQKKISMEINIPLHRELKSNFPKVKMKSRDWPSVLSSTARLKTPDARINEIFESAVRTLILLSAHDIYPGPYNYRRFWFRDACLMINALLALGLKERSRRLLDTFPGRQKSNGFFQSQEGEWDSNGQVLWIMDRYLCLTDERAPGVWLKAVSRGAQWLKSKRITKASGKRYQGLLPSGFSAEHFGPNDYYYWDNFWGLAGLKAGARLLGTSGLAKECEELEQTSTEYETAIWHSLVRATRHTPHKAFPAAPYRRMDAGAIGSMVADYPLQLLPPNNARIMATCQWLIKNCFYQGGFFQDMVHSGINCYLTLDLAQTLLRAGDDRYRNLVRNMSNLASPTGHWPEAVHPFSGGGCMGDGQHGWAAAEWVMMLRNIFIREEDTRLIIGSGIFPEWLNEEGELAFGPTPTPFGDLEVKIDKTDKGLFLSLTGQLRRTPLSIEARIPGTRPLTLAETGRNYKLETE